MTGEKTSASTGSFFRTTGNYRVLIDEEGTGHIRIIRRVNIGTIILGFRELFLEIRKNPETRPHIIIYLSRSLTVEMSGTRNSFLDFSVPVTGGIFELCTIE